MHTRALVIAESPGRLTALCHTLEGAGWQARGFVNPKDALSTLLSERFGAVFCDSLLKGASGSGFLAWTRRHAAGAAFYLIDNGGSVLRGHQPDGVLAFPLKAGAVPLPDAKGFDPKGFDVKEPDLKESDANRIKAGPAELHPKETNPYFSGNTSLIPLTDILEMIGLASHSVLVHLALPEGEGRIYIDAGRVMHAEIRSVGQVLRGFEALADLVAQEGCDFSVDMPEPCAERSIGLSAVGAMTEAMRLADEKRRYRHLLDSLRAACPALDTAAVGYALGNAPYLCDGDPAFFSEAREMFEALRRVAGTRVQDLATTVGDASVVVHRFGQDQLLTVRGPLAERGRLPLLVREALQSEA